jgi:hypothetical protein
MLKELVVVLRVPLKFTLSDILGPMKHQANGDWRPRALIWKKCKLHFYQNMTQGTINKVK